VSYAPGECGRDAYQAVYTKVPVVREWILKYCGFKKTPIEITKADAMP
jgi:secreted trypsin-like serine protease